MRLLLPLLCVLVGSSSGCSPVRAYCAAAADCDRDFVGTPRFDAAGNDDDSAGVCAVIVETELAVLRANEEEECKALADALERFYVCVSEQFQKTADGCEALFGGDGFSLNEADGPCDDEYDDVQDARSDINGDECSPQED
jgi:hypothetical protein